MERGEWGMPQKKGTVRTSARRQHLRVIHAAKKEPPTPALWLDLANEILKDGDSPLGLTPKAFAVLRYLHENPQRLVTKKELFAAVWPDTITTDGVLANCISELRKALQDSVTTPRYIVTVPRRGYRFLTPLSCVPAPVSRSYFSVPGKEEPLLTDDPGTKKEPQSLPDAPLSLQDGQRTADNDQAAPREAGRLAPDARRSEGERRQLTVMFCDVVDSTTLTTQMDPEDYHTLLQIYIRTCSDIITRYEGYIAQYLGDGILAYFGYPTAHEDAVRRAVQAGVEVITALHDRPVTLAGRGPIFLHARVGIHTGPVVIDEIGVGGRAERTALGETVNIAARLQTLAEPDTVIIDLLRWEKML
jgi:class 3 adenylate cyclase/DNA-binding winged helix-turn-helix (wHTH) protein